MKRWHLTLALALLAFGGATLAVGAVPVAGLAGYLYASPRAEPPVPPVELASAATPVVVDEIATPTPIAPAPVVAEALPEPIAAEPLRAPRPPAVDVHPMHVVPLEAPRVAAIPETQPVTPLPPDPPAPHRVDYCPPCGRG